MTAPVQVGPSSMGGGPAPFEDLDEYLADIGDRIRAERKARGWTETELARRAGVDRGTVRRIQDGIGPLRAFVQVCAGLGVDMDYLLSDRWVMPQRPPQRPSLAPVHVRVLEAVAEGRTPAEAAEALGMPLDGLRSRLSEIYRRLGVEQVSRGVERRAAAVRVAVEHGLITPPNRTS